MALRDRDIESAHALVERIRSLAPVDERLESVMGRAGSRFVRPLRASGEARRVFVRGVAVGCAVGVAGALLASWLVGGGGR